MISRIINKMSLATGNTFNTIKQKCRKTGKQHIMK